MEPVLRAITTSDGRDLSTFSWGEGDEVVVLEAGLGVSGRFWGPVARLLAKRVRVVAYDRAGFGASTPDPLPRTLDRLARDLCDVVDAQQARRLVLVGHSWGAPVVRRAIELLPDDSVLAMVLVDPSDETVEVYFSRTSIVADGVQSVILPTLARTGLLRHGLALITRGPLTADDRAGMVPASTSPQAVAAMLAENRQIRAGLLQLRDQGTSPRVPFTVISGTKRPPLGDPRKPLVLAHRRFVEANRGGRLIEARHSGHMVPLSEPALVAAEVLRHFS